MVEYDWAEGFGEGLGGSWGLVAKNVSSLVFFSLTCPFERSRTFVLTYWSDDEKSSDQMALVRPLFVVDE